MIDKVLRLVDKVGNRLLPVTRANLVENLYPVGSIYMSVNNTNPSEFFGGEWTAWGGDEFP
jgi:hypothetical protein